MIFFEKYEGKEIEGLPFEGLLYNTRLLFGRKVLRLDIQMSSGELDIYVYRNDKGEYFYVKGVLQYTSWFVSDPNRTKDYHLAMAIPFRSLNYLLEYLQGKIELKHCFDEEGNAYILKLDAPLYEYDGKWHPSMHPVKDGKEVTREYELELFEFGLQAIKIVPFKKLPEFQLLNMRFKYDYKRDMFNFLSEKEIKAIDVFIKSKKIQSCGKNPEIIIVNLLISPADNADQILFYQKLKDVYHPISRNELINKPLIDIINLAPNLYYQIP